MTTTTSTPRPTPAPRAARSARPGSPAPKLVWSNRDVTLNDGKPMTGRQAINHVHRHWANRVARITEAGHLAILSRGGATTVLTGTLPIPDDVHAAIQDLVLDLPLSIVQGDLLTKALEAAADGTDPAP